MTIVDEESSAATRGLKDSGGTIGKIARSLFPRDLRPASLPRHTLFILIMFAALLAPAFAQDLACTSCHGPDAKRVASPDCGGCHMGTALHAKGQLRFDDLFDGDAERKPVDNTFVVNQGAAYNTSVGHGGLKCAACHGDPHTQHTRVSWDCIQCHKVQLPKPEGPHGMHLAGEYWIRAHGLQVDENGAASCTGCHGPDGRGTVLSQVFADRTFNTKFGRKHFLKGTAVGCYACHSPSGTPK